MRQSLFLIAVFVFGGLLSHWAIAAEVYDTITLDELEAALKGGFDVKRDGELLLVQGKENTIGASLIG